FSLMISGPPSATRFPYTTLFRSARRGAVRGPRGSRQPEGAARHSSEVQYGHAASRLRCRRSRAAQRGTWRAAVAEDRRHVYASQDRKSTRLNSSHVKISYAVFCL